MLWYRNYIVITGAGACLLRDVPFSAIYFPAYATFKEKLVDAKLTRNMLQMEKDMIHDFYHNTRSEIKELEAKIKNLDTDMQTKEEGHRTELKVFMQKVRHLEYDHGNN